MTESSLASYQAPAEMQDWTKDWKNFEHPHPASLRPVSSNFAFSSVTAVESFLILLRLQTLGLERSIGASP